MMTLDQILGLVGPLDDTPGSDTPRERFRKFLQTSVTSIGEVRDYVEACTKNKGSQYDHALQDLVNHAGSLIGFDVHYGRYKGVTNDIGHDGIWRWKDFSIVVEVKTTDAFTIKTESLLGYVNKLISAGSIASPDQAMGLYVFARTDAGLTSLANSIVAEKRTHELRISTADIILSLAELVQEDNISPDEAVTLLKPAGVFVGETVQLLARISAHTTDLMPSTEPPIAAPISVVSPEPIVITHPAPIAPTNQISASHTESKRAYFMTPVRDEEDWSAQDAIKGLLSAGWYVFGDSTPGRKKIKPGDRICFYEKGVGVVAEAEVASVPERMPPKVNGIGKNLDAFPWSFRVRKPRFFFDKPIVIDVELRSKLDAFVGRDPTLVWSWFVQPTKLVTEHDFAVLTGKNDNS
jgi:hypothetical protein